MTDSSLDNSAALNPRASCVVEACAGSGKTWLLVSRMIRLLLAGAKPSELLAITFTRKAAQEMTDRLHAWLKELALGTDEEVRKFLRERKLPEAEIDALMPRARSLLEIVLTAQPGPGITTFHGWFLDLLKRAPLEAGLPWGAPVLDRTKLLQDEVRDRLLSKWATSPGSPEGMALLALLEEIGEFNLLSLLSNFIKSRSEWLAYTENQNDPVAFALDKLKSGLHSDLDSDPVDAFWSDELMHARARRVALALEKGSDAEYKKSQAIKQALADQDIEALWKKILKADGGRLASKGTKALLAALANDADTYLRDYEALEDALERISGIQSAQRIWNLNRYGLLLGNALLSAYQQAKAERGVIDFADVEWLGCQLLESEEHAPALNLKLDARYRHLLLDEFQDTNPLQWRTLSTWLAEAHAADSGMTVFMVGDPKQAIYRFRRGEARVFKAAAEFLQAHFDAPYLANNQTRRLAPQVVTAINSVFEGTEGFSPHTPVEGNETLPGAVRFLAVNAPDNGTAIEENGLRNPLTTPLPEAGDRAVHEEAREFARTLQEDVIGKWCIRDKSGERNARPGDIMGLVRQRTHLKIYEQALEQAGIPYITSRRGGLLHALEAQDIIALLETLLLPHAALKLAHVLKSPLFSCSDTELMQVFQREGVSGWDRLAVCAKEQDCPAGLKRAAGLLTGWKAWAGILPVHDLLDRIYFEGDMEARYAAASPASTRPQVAANLRAFLQLALTQGAGRYPSLGGFIRELKSLVEDSEAAPEEGIAADGENAVRLLTIHGAKGLEAPVVWLLSGSYSKKDSHHDVLAPWPPEARKPEHFSLYGKKEDRGEFREAWFADEAVLNEQEETNLLYVALTRTKQALLVSGDGARNKEGEITHPWLRRIFSCWEKTGFDIDLPKSHVLEVQPELTRSPYMTSPSIGTRVVETTQSGAEAVGELIHACLECFAPPGANRDLQDLAKRLGVDTTTFEKAQITAQGLIAHSDLKRFFDPAHYLHARNELPVVTNSGQVQRIDRLVEFEDEIWVLDYKTGKADAAHDDAALVQEYRPQLQAYVYAAKSLFPFKSVRCGIILADGRLVAL